jgi:hypothetical protein
MGAIKLVLPAVILVAGFVVGSSMSYGTPAYAKTEKKGCTFCHTVVKPSDKEAMAKSLTAAGKYYKEHDHSLTGYTESK